MAKWLERVSRGYTVETAQAVMTLQEDVSDIRTALALLERARDETGHEIECPSNGVVTRAHSPHCLKCELDRELG